MRFMRPSRAWQTGLVLAVLLLAIAAPAKSGREFSGYFDVSGVHDEGDLVQLTLHLKLFNHSDADARGVIVALANSGPSMMLRGSFQPVKVWKSQHFLEMSQEFTVSKQEFREWMTAPAQPNLIIMYEDARGKSWQQGAQMSRRVLVQPGE